MIMNILIMRHGDAVRAAASDAARTLTDKGKRDVFNVAQSIRAESIDIERLISSTYTRAFETAQIVAQVFNIDTEIITCPDITPNTPPHIAIRSLDPLLKPNTLVVSHLPLVSHLLASLVGGGVEANDIPMTTAACVWLTGETWGEACLEIKSLRDPVTI